MGRPTGMAPPRKQMAWMDALVPCFSSSTTMCNESEPRSISQHIAYRGEAKEAVAALAPAECHCVIVKPRNRNGETEIVAVVIYEWYDHANSFLIGRKNKGHIT
jgi:hypothetical protein